MGGWGMGSGSGFGGFDFRVHPEMCGYRGLVECWGRSGWDWIGLGRIRLEIGVGGGGGSMYRRLSTTYGARHIGKRHVCRRFN